MRRGRLQGHSGKVCAPERGSGFPGSRHYDFALPIYSTVGT